MNIQVLRALAQQYVLPKLAEMDLSELDQLRGLFNELIDAAIRAGRAKELTDGG